MKVECSLNAISGLAQLPNIKQGLVYKLELSQVIGDSNLLERIGTYYTLNDTFVKVFWYNSMLPLGMTRLSHIVLDWLQSASQVKMYWKLILQGPRFVPFGANMTNFGTNPDIPG